ncbi:MAG: hypothetical protein PHR26_00685 [Candidatus ainarchaeum sp.]|nr:hypothetical protein [Candidatus ainarchaeum sp.]MDD3976250.1 hypothetical protein [Candidatus ainarchaeum sp.]
MAVIKKIDDSLRVKILSSLTLKGCVVPNIRQIKKVTGFHRATIKSSIDFLESEKFITGYRPLLDSLKIGYNLKNNNYFQIDLNNKDNFKKILDIIKKDNSVMYCSEVISDGNYNIAVTFLSKNIESHHINIKKKYISNIPNYYDIIKNNSNFFLSGEIYKNKNEIDVLIDLLKENIGE